MNPESLQRIDGFLSSSTQELFNAIGIEIPPNAQRRADVESPLTATIGFTSANLRGLLVLTLDRGLAVRSLPPNFSKEEAGDGIVADWTGELSNQLLGRLKNKFHAVGIDISLSTPIVFMGKEMRHFTNAAPIHRMIFFDEGRILTEFQACYDEEIEIPETSESLEPSQPEGEALFF
jgi:CheY-specific phosphatase CheX